MANTTRKAVELIPATTEEKSEVVEGGLSEQQTEILTADNETTDTSVETETVSEETSDDNSEAEKEISEEADKQTISEEKAKQLKEENYGYLAAEIQNLIDTGIIKDKADKLLHINELVKTDKATEAEGFRLRQQFEVSEQATNASGSSTLSENSEAKQTIRENYMPFYAEAADATEPVVAAKAATEIVDKLLRQKQDYEGNAKANLCNAFADIAHFYMKKDQLPVAVRKDPNTGALLCVMHQQLWNKVRVEKLLGETQEAIVKTGSFSEDYGTLRNPYTDRQLAPYVKPATVIACLLAYGKVTGVKFGYLPRKGNSGKRFNRQMAFVENVNNPDDYFRCVCVPDNILKPWNLVYKIVPKDKGNIVQAKIDDANTDDTLRYLTDEVAEALYQHHFASHVLTYDMEQRGSEKAPSGTITGSHDKTVGPNARQRNTSESGGSVEEVAELKQQVETLRMERDKAQAGIDMEHIVSTLMALDGLMSNTRLNVTVGIQMNALALAETVIRKRLIPNMNGNAKDVLGALVKLQKCISSVVDWNDDEGVYYLQGKDGVILAKQQ